MQHISTRAPAPHTVHQINPRMQSPAMQMQLNAVNQSLANNAPYNAYANTNVSQQNVQVGKNKHEDELLNNIF